MKIRVPADHAGATIREAAWGLEERVLWKGSDATRSAMDRAERSLRPLQRLIQTKLTWPLGDALRARSRATRAVIGASAAALAVAAGTAGGITGAGQSSTDQSASMLMPPASVTRAPSGDGTV